ncbi:Copia protein-like Protein [Tribolium castaneum]|uniref:Copia protein-like Protein n=1 Tax=Tribolium castaneum TaxID=7070 RepID=D7ELU5_TRICA|nr:Copia protein-like Protein [Tribolium castaneum]
MTKTIKLKNPRKNHYQKLKIEEVEGDTPNTYDESITSSESEEWRNAIAIQEELDALKKNDTWNLVNLPVDKKVIGSKWVFKIKRSPNNKNIRYKARLCAKGFAQTNRVSTLPTTARPPPQHK